jgi:hypothetical protein
MLAVELRGLVPDDVAASLTAIADVSVLGPLDIDDGKRWLLQGELRQARRELRVLVGRWRDKGATVRIDSDPIDL